MEEKKWKMLQLQNIFFIQSDKRNIMVAVNAEMTSDHLAKERASCFKASAIKFNVASTAFITVAGGQETAALRPWALHFVPFYLWRQNKPHTSDGAAH